jgi:hypothetical protein
VGEKGADKGVNKMGTTTDCCVDVIQLPDASWYNAASQAHTWRLSGIRRAIILDMLEHHSQLFPGFNLHDLDALASR